VGIIMIGGPSSFKHMDVIAQTILGTQRSVGVINLLPIMFRLLPCSYARLPCRCIASRQPGFKAAPAHSLSSISI